MAPHLPNQRLQRCQIANDDLNTAFQGLQHRRGTPRVEGLETHVFVMKHRGKSQYHDTLGLRRASRNANITIRKNLRLRMSELLLNLFKEIVDESDARGSRVAAAIYSKG